MNFVECLKQALAARSVDPGAFQAHIARIEQLFEEQLEQMKAAGARDLPGADAREQIVAAEALAVAERKKRRAKALSLHAEYTARIDQARTGDPVTSAWLLDKKDKTGGVALSDRRGDLGIYLNLAGWGPLPRNPPFHRRRKTG